METYFGKNNKLDGLLRQADGFAKKSKQNFSTSGPPTLDRIRAGKTRFFASSKFFRKTPRMLIFQTATLAAYKQRFFSQTELL